MKVVRLKFQPGSYASAKGLIKEINRGLRSSFQVVWSKTVDVPGKSDSSSQTPAKTEKK